MAELNESEAPQGTSETASAQSEEGQAVESTAAQNAYSEEQFKGLQSSLSRQINEANQRAEAAEKAAETARQQAFGAAVANVEDPEEQNQLRLQFAAQEAQKRIDAAEAKAQSATALAESAGKHLAAQELAAKYGIPAEVLQGSTSLESMESTAKMFRDTVQREISAKTSTEASQESEPDSGPGAPAVDSGTGGGGAGVSDNSDIEHTGKVAEGLARARAAMNAR